MPPISNTPSLWLDRFPFPTPQQHKYSRGHVVVNGGGIETTGAASMTAIAALRAGAGLVTIACDKHSQPLYAARSMSVMTAITKNLNALVQDERKTTFAIGPGNGVNAATRRAVLTALKAKKRCVLDADALTVFAADPWVLFEAIASPVILTPHEGEFRRLFPSLFDKNLDRTTTAQEAARLSKATIILKGHETVIAHPDGQTCLNTNAPPWLATAGSGDVLTGLVAAMLANNLDPFTAASIAAWIHGEAANMAGIGLIAEELPDYVPVVLRRLWRR